MSVLTTGQTCVLSVHNDDFSAEDLILNPEIFGSVKAGDVVEVEKALMLKVTTMGPVRGNIQISIRKAVADLFGLQIRQQVLVRRVDVDAVGLDYIELSFKDQFISRSDMWRLASSLTGSVAYRSKEFSFAGMRATVKEMMRNSLLVPSGLITPTTKCTFRSRSANFFLLIQMSTELWQFASDGDMYYEKLCNMLLRDMFDRWVAGGVSHKFNVILFARVESYDENTGHKILRDEYKVVADREKPSSLGELVKLIRAEIMGFPSLVGWNPYSDGVHREAAHAVKITRAQEGNFLEALNIVLDSFDRHYIDRDLTHTGQTIVVFTASNGVYDVDELLMNITDQRMAETGAAVDLVSLSSRPLHAVPLFRVLPPVGVVSAAIRFEVPQFVQTMFLDNSTRFEAPDVSIVSLRHGNDRRDSTASNRGGSGRAADIMFSIPKMAPHIPLQSMRVIASKISEACQSHMTAGVKMSSSLVDLAHSQGNDRHSHPSSLSSSPVHGSPLMSSGPESLSNSRSVSINAGLSSRAGSLAPNSNIGDGVPSSMESGSVGAGSAGIPSGMGSRIRSRRDSRKMSMMRAALGTTSLFQMTKIFDPFKPKARLGGRDGSLGPQPQPLIFTELGDADDPNEMPEIDGNSGVRWFHLFPDPTRASGSLKWKSLSEPAIMPLTAAFFPKQKELSTFMFYNYQLTSSGMYVDKPDVLMRELVCQRLHQGFQLANAEGETSTPQAVQDVAKGVRRQRPAVRLRFLLSKRGQYHILEYDAVNEFINVSIFRKREDTSKVGQTRFLTDCHFWNPLAQTFISRSVSWTGARDPVRDYNWNFMDALVCGDESSLSENTRFRRVKFVIIPSDGLPAAGGLRTYLPSILTKDGARTLTMQDPSAIEEDVKKRFTTFAKFIESVTTRNVKTAAHSDKVSLTSDMGWYPYLMETSSGAGGGSRVPTFVSIEKKKLPPVQTVCLEPQNVQSSRYEWINLLFSSVYSPDASAVLAIEWLVCTGMVVEDFLQSCVRRAKQSGLQMIQIPHELPRSTDLLQFSLDVSFDSTADAAMMVQHLISDRFKFWPVQVPVRVDSYLVHESGCSAVCIVNECTLRWMPNPLSPPSSRAIEASLLQRFKMTCDAVRAVSQTVSHLLQASVDATIGERLMQV